MTNKKLREHLAGYRRMLPIIMLKELLMIIICTIPYAFGVNQLLVPHSVVGGGVTGICEIIYFATNSYIPIWVSSAVLNLTLLIVSALTYSMGSFMVDHMAARDTYCYRTHLDRSVYGSGNRWIVYRLFLGYLFLE